MRLRFLVVFVFGLALVSVSFAGVIYARPQEGRQQQQAVTSGQPAGAPVVVGGKTLFYVQARMFTFSPEDRAKTIAERVEWLSKQSPARIRAVHTENAETTTAIVSDDTVIATITDGDAQASGKDRTDLAQEYTQIVRDNALALREQHSLRTILLGTLYALLATALLGLIFRFLGYIFSKLHGKLDLWHGVYIRSIRIQRLELVPAARITSFLHTTATVARAVLSISLVYGYVAVVTSFFPWTQGYSATLLEYFLAPLRIVWNALTNYLPNLFFLAVIFVVAYYLTMFVKVLFRELGRGTISLPGFYAEWAIPTYKIVRVLIAAFTLIVAFPYLPGSKSPAFQGVSIFFGLLLSLGSSSAISNVVAGTVLTYTRAFQLGDRVKIGETTGDIVEKTLLVTRVRTIKNVDIAIPNAMVLSSHIVNFSSVAKQNGLILHTGVTIGYDAPWRKIHELLISAAEATTNVQREPKPFVLQTALNDFYVSYEINAFTDQASRMASTYSELHQNIQDKFYEAGVEIMSPHHFGVRDSNRSAIPAEYLAQNYVAPGFRVVALDSLAEGKKGAETASERG
ncbi:MAG TPA: mechanosensitive ion channel domain-containing protein [Candidatus Aquilonibacter sp.]|nr:mechanosensitive ion channel domain-containing protein [Candidatus Aquilonibacter sp.]